MGKWNVYSIILLWTLEVLFNQARAKCGICRGGGNGPPNIDLEDYLDTPENRRQEQFSTSSSRHYGLPSRNRILARKQYHLPVPATQHGLHPGTHSKLNAFNPRALAHNNHLANVHSQNEQIPHTDQLNYPPNVHSQNRQIPHTDQLINPPNVPFQNQFNQNPIHHPQRVPFNAQNFPGPHPPFSVNPNNHISPHHPLPQVQSHPDGHPPVSSQPPNLPNLSGLSRALPYGANSRAPQPFPHDLPPQNVPNSYGASIGRTPLAFHQPQPPHSLHSVPPPVPLPPHQPFEVPVQPTWPSLHRYADYSQGYVQTYFTGDYGDLSSIGNSAHVSYGTEINHGHSYQHSHSYRFYG